MYYEFIFILGVLYVGIVSSYTDIRFGKIRNKTLIHGLLIAILGHFLLLLEWFLQNSSLNSVFYFNYSVNLFLTLLISLIFYKINIWTAGDAKLIFVYNFLLLPNFVNFSIPYFYGFLIFFNVFFTLFFYFLLSILFKIRKINFLESLKGTFRIYSLFGIFLFVFIFQNLLVYLSDFLSQNSFLLLILLFVFYSFLESNLGENRNNFFIAISVVLIVFNVDKLQTMDFWFNYMFKTLFLLLLRFLIIRISYYVFTKDVDLGNLKEGMKLAEYLELVEIDDSGKKVVPCVNELKKLQRTGKNKHFKAVKKELNILNLFSFSKIDFFFSLLTPRYSFSEGLTQKHIVHIKKARQKKELLFKSLRVFETMPFALFIFIGTLITILLKEDIFLFISRLIL